MISKGINASVKGNDIVVDDKYKVCGVSASHSFLGMNFYVMFVAINSNKDLIEKICLKPMYKIPTGLSQYSIEADDIIQAVTEGEKIEELY